MRSRLNSQRTSRFRSQGWAGFCMDKMGSWLPTCEVCCTFAAQISRGKFYGYYDERKRISRSGNFSRCWLQALNQLSCEDRP